MKRFCQNIKGRKITSFFVLIPFLFYLAALSLQAILIPSSATDVAYAAHELTVSRQSAKEALSYLKKLDTNAGRTDFQLYIDDLQLEQERLIRVRNNLIYQFVKDYQYQSQPSSLISPDFVDLDPLHESSDRSEITISDLKARIERAVETELLMIRFSQSIREILPVMRENDALLHYDDLQNKFEIETSLINAIKSFNGSAFNSLLAELYTEHQMTDFWLNYAGSGIDLFKQLETFSSTELYLIEEKTLREQTLLDLFEALYPSEEDLSLPLDDPQYYLFNLYTETFNDQQILDFLGGLLQSEMILSYLNDDRFTVSPDLPLQVQLTEVLLKAIQDGENADPMADSLLTFLIEKNQTSLKTNFTFNNQYEALKIFNDLSNFTHSIDYQDKVDSVIEMYPFVLSLLESFSSRLQDSLEPESDPEAQISDPEAQISDLETEVPTDEEIVTEETPTEEEIISDPEAQISDPEAQISDPEAQISDPEAEVLSEPETVVDSEPQSFIDEVVDFLFDIPSEESVTNIPPVVPDQEVATPADDLKESAEEAILDPEAQISDIETETPILSDSAEVTSEPETVTEETPTDEEAISDPETQISDPETQISDLETEVPTDEEMVTEETVTEETPTDEETVTEETPTDEEVISDPETQISDLETEVPTDEEMVTEETVTEETPTDEETVTEETPVEDSEPAEVVEEETPIVSQNRITTEELLNIFGLIDSTSSNILEETIFINQLIDANPVIIEIDELIYQLEQEARFAFIIQDLINEIAASSVEFQVFREHLQSIALTSDEFDLLISLMNQLVVNFGYADDLGFSGMSGILQFGSELCPLITDWHSLDLGDENEDFSFLNPDQQGQFQLSKQENNQDPNYVYLKNFRDLNVDFCLKESSDISTKTLVGHPGFVKQIVNDYKISQKGINLQFENDLDRTVRIHLNGDEGSFSMKQFNELTTESFVAPFVTETVEESILGAIEDKIGVVTDVEGIDEVSEAIEDILGEVGSTLSVLENPDQLFTPLDVHQEDAFEQVIVFESDDHRENTVQIFLDDSHKIIPRQLDHYIVYNYGSGFEEKVFEFENIVFHEKSNGVLEGYYFDSATYESAEEASADLNNIYLNGGKEAPVFVISKPFALDKENNLSEGFTYRVAGDFHNQLLLVLNTSQESYPSVLHFEMAFTDPSQLYFDRTFEPATQANSGYFGASQVIGDFNGDSLSDIAIGSFASRSNQGDASIYFSGSEKPGVIISGGPSSYFAYSLQVADLNHDGFDELIAGSPLYDGARGRLWIFDGKNLSLGASQRSLDTADFMIEGAGVSDHFAFSINTGDFNADGMTDLAISSPGDANDQGRVHLFFNEMTEDQFHFAENSADADIVLLGENQEGSRFGERMAVGDFDTDGKDDLLVSAPYFDDLDALNAGRVYLFLQDEFNWTRLDSDCVHGCLAKDADWIFTGEYTDDRFGTGLSVGDFNSDGKDDFAVGVPQFDLGSEYNQGRVHLFYQGGSAMTIPDTCESACFEIDSIDSDVKILGGIGNGLGFSLLSADLNKDGNDDLVVGAHRFDGGRGRAYIFYGDPNSELPNIASEGFIEAMQNYNVKWEGDLMGSFGYSFAAGDFNVDGVLDLSIGAPHYYDLSGHTYVFYGEAAKVIQPSGTDFQPVEEVVEEEPVEEVLTEEETEFDVNLDQLEGVLDDETLKESADETKDFLLDILPAGDPVITCDGIESGVFANKSFVSCQWTDTAGPSAGTYRYCIDSDDTCVPENLRHERSIEIINLNQRHTYLRVETEDFGGKSNIVSFDITIDRLPVILGQPSDGGSDETTPTLEGENITFSATAGDPEDDPYYLLLCRTSDMPRYTGEAQPQCLGSMDNRYCISPLTPSGQPASCFYSTREEPVDISLWYAFVCDSHDGGGHCSSAYQGTGANGSPFYVQHPARFDGVEVTDTDGGSIEPGDRLKFTLPSSHITDVSEGSSVSLYICSSDSKGFDYQKNTCEGGDLICASGPVDMNTGPAVCLEDESKAPLVSVPSAVSEKFFTVFVEHGEKGLVDGSHRQNYFISNIAPTIIDYKNEGAISILGGESTDVEFSAVLEDLNGADDIAAAEGVFFDSDGVWNDCEENGNDCYIDPDCTLTPLSETRVEAKCVAEVYYNANASNYWKVHVNTVDSAGVKNIKHGDSKSDRVIPPLVAINQEEISIPYKLTVPGQVSEAVETILTNLGNQQVDVLIDGTDLTGADITLSKSLQKWSLKSDFDYETEGYPLTETAIPNSDSREGCMNVSLPVHNGEIHEVPVYWKIYIPKNQKSDVYSGSVYFSPITDDCSDSKPVYTPLSSLNLTDTEEVLNGPLGTSVQEILQSE